MPSSPTFPMSSCLTGGSGGGRAYRFELDVVVKSSSPSPRSSHSSPSSTLSESSNSTPLFTSTKRARAPRKRPNQCSAEAAALLATVYPKLFSASNLHQPISLRRHPPDDPFPVLLPSFPIRGDGGIPLHEPPPSLETPLIGPEVRLAKLANVSIRSPPDFQDPASPGFDAESILEEEVEEGIDSIMDNLSMSTNLSKDEKGDCSSNLLINPYLASMVGFGIGGGFEFSFGISSNIGHALRQTDDGEWWRTPAVAVKDIIGSFTEPPTKNAAAHKKKKKKKKVEKEAAVEAKAIITHASPPGNGILKPQLGLKLNYDDFLKLWCGGSPFSDETGSPESAADAIARLADIDLFPDTDGGAVREASVQRYKEKRRTRLFSKKIRYQVRKANADQRPRMKGRFVRTPTLFQEAMGEQGVDAFLGP